MSVTCSACGYDKNPDGSEFCDACGSELVTDDTPEILDESFPIPPTQEIDSVDTSSTTPESSVISPQIPNPGIPSPSIPTEPSSIPTKPKPLGGGLAKLLAKQVGAPVPEFAIDNGSAMIGMFDPDIGPVEIDLEGFLGNETVSRNHAEIYQEAGEWKIKDLGSTNGVFIKPLGQSRFNSRITVPTEINSGDEIAIAKVRFLFECP
ncbi:zinc-ribbon and FHA domain-containing protein [Acaryochloris sp. 'Moss Beach']|uniref:FHA domain-containing protein n=1 Tax=Acaryochloris sp. 'Moss Beach' TaxID=2740837 RepID=UPI001F2A2700|nr:FHA domain-containing protein [Acaryochloris sp. 'Moss Beach']UJB68987.1 zinc-ribbon and FHA domain-containing protein [Acaryochloris sp. 'Moss Beach']